MEAIGMIETKGLLAAIESADAMLKAAEVRLLERTFVGGGLVTITITGDVAAVKASIDAAAASVARLGEELLVSQHVIPRPHTELGETILSPIPLAERCHKEPEEEKAEEEPAEIRPLAQEPETEPEKPVKQEEEPEIESEEPEQEQLQIGSEEEAEEQEEQAEEQEEQVEETDGQEELPEDESSQQEDDLSGEKASQMHKADLDRMVETSGLDNAMAALEKCKVVKLRNLAREYEDFGIAGRLISKANKTALIEEFKKYYNEKQ